MYVCIDFFFHILSIVWSHYLPANLDPGSKPGPPRLYLHLKDPCQSSGAAFPPSLLRWGESHKWFILSFFNTSIPLCFFDHTRFASQTRSFLARPQIRWVESGLVGSLWCPFPESCRFPLWKKSQLAHTSVTSVFTIPMPVLPHPWQPSREWACLQSRWRSLLFPHPRVACTMSEGTSRSHLTWGRRWCPGGLCKRGRPPRRRAPRLWPTVDTNWQWWWRRNFYWARGTNRYEIN